MPGENEGGFLVSRVHQLSGRIFERMLREAGLGSLTAARGRIVFAMMRKDGISQNELAAMVKLDKSGLALTLGELETDGLVTRERSASDRRQCLVRRTPRFDQLTRSFNDVSRQMNELYYKGLAEGEVTAFETTLRHILMNLENLDQTAVSPYTEEKMTQ
mgnify:CR=1 FL=1